MAVAITTNKYRLKYRSIRFQPLISLSIIVMLLLAYVLQFKVTDCKKQYVQVLNSGLHTSQPYDIANIFRRPVAAIISIVLTIFLAVFIFFGIITSPFGYFFGIPSRKYVLGGVNTTSKASNLPISSRILNLDYKMEPRNLDLDWEENFQDVNSSKGFLSAFHYPNFMESMFKFFPEDENLQDDLPCGLIIVCYAHSGIQYLPNGIIRVYKLFR